MYTGKPVVVMEIKSQDYNETLAFPAETKPDRKTLIRDAEEEEKNRKKRKKKK